MMNPLMIVMISSWLAGALAFVGGLFARIEGTAETEAKQELVHGVVAFGGGILLAAVAFALVPMGISLLRPAVLVVTFPLGGKAFAAWTFG